MSNKLYTTIPAPKVKRNTFNRSRYNSITLPYQRVCPVAVEEIYPGDIYRWGAELFARTAPMVAPVMTDQRLSLHAFWVPLRTINKHYSEFMYNNRQGNYAQVLPYTTLGNLYNVVNQMFTTASYLPFCPDVIRLYDYIGLPFVYKSATDLSSFVSEWLTTNSGLASSTLRINLGPFFAYQKVWNEYFRDENVVDDLFDQWAGYGYSPVDDLTGYVDLSATSGTGLQLVRRFGLVWFRLRPRAWQHDRFTSALPFAQRGPDVLLPVTGQVQVVQDGPGVGGDVKWNGSDGEMYVETAEPADEPLDLFGDITGISTTINDFRRAERLQRWYENSARGGVRQNEATLAHFGVRTDDATLDRAVFLGGSRQPIVISEIAQTSETTANSPQGTLAGKGSSYKSGRLFRSFFKEHGYVFVFASALIRPIYFQGIPRLFSRMQRDEYYWPEFALLGEEPVFDKELFVDANTTEDGVFGYVPRYSDLKSAVNECHGDFRDSLAFWVNSRKFANKPELNSEFIFGDPQKLMYAVQSNYTDSLLLTIRHDVRASRLMPFYGVPTI